jgi:hypothetical protein
MEDLPDHGNRRQHQFIDQVETCLFRNPLIRYKKIRGSRYWFFVNNQEEEEEEEEKEAPPPRQFTYSPPRQFTYSPPRSPSYDPMME